MATEATEADIEAYKDEQCDETQALIPMEEVSSTVEGEFDKGIRYRTVNRYLNELYDKEVDIKSNLSDQEISDIRTAVDQQVKLLTETIGEIDPRFRIREVILVGSAREGTQIVRPYEYDYILVLDVFSKPGAVSLAFPEDYVEEASLEFVHVNLEDVAIRSLFHEHIHNDESCFPIFRKEGLGYLFYALVSRSVRLCSNRLVEKSTGTLKCKNSKPEQHGPACTVMLEWRGNHSKSPMTISVDLCQALKIPWDVYENMLQSNDCDVSDDFKNHMQNVGSLLLMPHIALNAFKVTFTEAELLLTADLSEHHIKCYKLLKYIADPEIHPPQTFTKKMKFLFKDTFFPSYALKIMVWNHQFTQNCTEENDIFSCFLQMFLNNNSDNSLDEKLKHPFNRNSGVKVTSDGSGKEKLWGQTRFRRLGMLSGLVSVQKMSSDKFDNETCCGKLHFRSYGRYTRNLIYVPLFLFGLLVIELSVLVMYLKGTYSLTFSLVFGVLNLAISLLMCLISLCLRKKNGGLCVT